MYLTAGSIQFNLNLFIIHLINYLSFLPGRCLKCYQCLSARDWDDCASKKSKQLCPLGTDTCIKLLQKLPAWGGSMYAKGCTSQSWCKDVLKTEDCKAGCVVNCCSSPLCNGAKKPLVSVIILLACVFLAVFGSAVSSPIRL